MTLKDLRKLLHADILSVLKRRKLISPNDDPTSFGNIALERKYISEDILKGAVLVQNERLKIGEILVSMGQLTPSQCEEILLEQEALRASSSEDKALIEMKRQRVLLKNATRKLQGVLKGEPEES